MNKSKKKKEDKNKITQTARFRNLIDISVNSEEKTVFLLKQDASNELKVRTRIKKGVKDFIVPPKRNNMPWMLPRLLEVLKYYEEDSDKCLFQDIRQAIYDNSDLPDKRLYTFLAAWVLHTYLIDKFQYTPIIMFYAVMARGKTRTASVITWMSRRGIYVTAIRPPDIFRKADRFESTIFFDVLDISKISKGGEIQDMIMSRFERGSVVPRILFPERGFDDTQHFQCFSPSIYAINEPPHHIMASRSIVINMLPSNRTFEDSPQQKDFLCLRERATAFRARWINQDLPDIKKPSAERLGDIMKPIMQIIEIVAPEERENMLSLIKTFADEKADSLVDTPEGRIIDALIDLETLVENGVITTDYITAYLNYDTLSRYQVGSVSVGKRMVALGFQGKKTKQKRGYIYDKKLIEMLAVQYGLSYKLPEDFEEGDDNKQDIPRSSVNHPEFFEDITDFDSIPTKEDKIEKIAYHFEKDENKKEKFLNEAEREKMDEDLEVMDREINDYEYNS